MKILKEIKQIIRETWWMIIIIILVFILIFYFSGMYDCFIDPSGCDWETTNITRDLLT